LSFSAIRNNKRKKKKIFGEVNPCEGTMVGMTCTNRYENDVYSPVQIAMRHKCMIVKLVNDGNETGW
jgi:hypothetical protein